MNQKIIAVVGVSGVGKTTFLKKVGATLLFQHLTAGSLIAQARAADASNRDDLRLSDLDENQSLLIQGFTEARDQTARIIVLDGHVVIHNETGLSTIASQVFSCLGINLIAHLEADPAQVKANRTLDTKRKRPNISVNEICDHQAHSLAEAQRVANDLGIALKRLTHDDADLFSNYLIGTDTLLN